MTHLPAPSETDIDNFVRTVKKLEAALPVGYRNTWLPLVGAVTLHLLTAWAAAALEDKT